MELVRQILLVEDVEAHALLIRRAFEEGTLRCEVTHIRSLREALNLMGSHDWDLVLADLRLPDGLGTDLLSSHTLAFCPPIIIMTSHGDQAVAVDAMKAGALDYIVKSPETLADISHIAEHALREWGHLLDRIEADEALRESEARYRTLAENSPDLIQRFDRKLRHLYANHTAERLTGIPADRFLHKTCRDIGYDDELAEFLEEQLKKTFDSGQPLETNYKTEINGQDRLFNLRLIPEIGQDHQVETVLSIARDLTEHHEIKTALEKSEERYGILFETMQDGFALHEMIRDPEGRIVDYRFIEINPAYEQMTGRSAENIVGKTASEVEGELETILLSRFIEVTESERSSRFQLFSSELDKHLEYVAFVPSSEHVAVLIEDVTERVQLQERLRHSEKMEAIGQLAGGVAHDFNNQLACIMGFADLLRTKLKDTPEMARYAEMIVNASGRSAQLTKQLLAFARKGQYRATQLDVHELITESVQLLEHSLNKKTCIERHLDCQSPVILGDPSQLQNALLNIAINADAAMPDGGTLTFATRRVTLDAEFCRNQADEIEPGDYLEISLTDTGTGMEEHVLNRIFEPFFTTKPPGEGTGMGLAAVYGTVRNHNGTIHVESEFGNGTTFRLYFPVLDSPAGIAAGTDEQEPESTHHGEGCILVVDDEELVRDMAQALLQELGYTVLTAVDGPEGLRVFEEFKDFIDLVVLDMSMPGMNGRDTYLKMREVDPKVKAILSSGYGLASEVQEAINDGVLEFIHKPFQVNELSRVLEFAVGPAAQT